MDVAPRLLAPLQPESCLRPPADLWIGEVVVLVAPLAAQLMGEQVGWSAKLFALPQPGVSAEQRRFGGVSPEATDAFLREADVPTTSC